MVIGVEDISRKMDEDGGCSSGEFTAERVVRVEDVERRSIDGERVIEPICDGGSAVDVELIPKVIFVS